MKHHRGLVVCLLAAGLCFAGPARALVPRPLCIFYGEATDDYGWPYLLDARVILRIGGTEYSRCEIDSMKAPAVNFILRVPLDSGPGVPYSPFAATNNADIEVVVQTRGIERPILQTNALPRMGNPGDVICLNITAGQDTDHDGLPDEFERWIIYDSWFDLIDGLADVNPDDDYDGDGVSNLQELLAGTDPAWVLDYFFAEEMTLTLNGKVKISVLSIPGKSYAVFSAPELVNPSWTMCPYSTSENGSVMSGYTVGYGEYMSFYMEPTDNRRLFRLEVK